MSFRSSLGRLTLVVAALSVLPAAALAQTSRVEGMTLQGDYIKDYTGIYTYVSGVAGVGNLVYGELGNLMTNANTQTFGTGYPGTLDRAVGAVLGNLWDGRYGAWAIHLREETPALGQGDNFSQPNPGAGGFDPNANGNESFDLMWAKKFGTASFGLRFNRSHFQLKNDLVAPGIASNLQYDPMSLGVQGNMNLARNVTGFGAGIGFEMSANSNVEIGVLYQSRTFSAEGPAVGPFPGGGPAAGDIIEDNGPTTYMVAGRMMWQWQPNVVLVPVVKYYSFDLSTRHVLAGAVTTFDNSLRGWQAGLAGNWSIGNNDLFVLGATIARNKVEEEEDLFGLAAAAGSSPDMTATESLMPNVFAGLETHVNNWLTLRMGATKGVVNRLKVEDNAAGGPTVEVTGSPFAMNIGCGVKLGTLQLDAIMNSFFPQTLGGFFGNLSGPTGITGVSGFTAFPKVTATYSF